MTKTEKPKEDFKLRMYTLLKEPTYSKGIWKDAEFEIHATNRLAFAVRIGDSRKKATIAMSRKQKLETRNHLFVSVSTTPGSDPSTEQERKGLFELMHKVLSEMLLCWEQSVDDLSKEGIVFVKDVEELRIDFETHSLLEEKYRIQDAVAFGLNCYLRERSEDTRDTHGHSVVISARLSPSLKKEFQTLSELDEFYSSLQAKEPLLDLLSETGCLGLFGDDFDAEGYSRKSFPINHYGATLNLHHAKDYQNARVEFPVERNKKPVHIDIEENALLKVLNEEKEELRLLNIVEPSKQYYRKMTTKLFGYEDGEEMQRLYSTLETHFDSWEAIEIFAKTILIKHGEKEYTKLCDLKSALPNTFSDFKVLRFDMANEFAHFISYDERLHYSTSTKSIIIFSKEKKPDSLRKLAMSIVLPSF